MSIVVKAKKGETSDSLINRFMKKVENSGLKRELQERRFYKKPSVLRQERIRKKWRKINKKLNDK